MNFVYILVLIAAAATAAATADEEKLQKCRDISLYEIDYKKMMQLGPFMIFRSTEENYKCSQVSYTNFVGSRSCYTGQSIVVNQDKTFTYDVTLEDGLVFRATQCNDGSRGDYRVIVSKLDNLTSSYFCVVTCDDDGNYVHTLVCAGRTYKDEMAIDNYLRKEFKGRMSKPIYTLQADCDDHQQHCNAY